MKVVDSETFHKAVGKMHEVVFTDSGADFYSAVLESSLNESVSSLSNFSNANGELDQPIKILKRLSGQQLYSIMTKHVKNSSENWKVVCHGDLWINNLMFHYQDGKVNNVKLVDLQTIRYTNLTCDILMLLYSSTEGAMRSKHMDQLIEIYHESLISSLRDYLENKSYRQELATLEHEFTLENIKSELAVRSLYGLGTSLWVMPAVTFVSLSLSLMKTINQESHDEIMMQLQPKEYHARVRDIVKEFYERGFLDNIFIDI